jgi:hypothetical protein
MAFVQLNVIYLDRHTFLDLHVVSLHITFQPGPRQLLAIAKLLFLSEEWFGPADSVCYIRASTFLRTDSYPRSGNTRARRLHHPIFTDCMHALNHEYRCAVVPRAPLTLTPS